MATLSPYQLVVRGLDEATVYRLPSGQTRIGRNAGNELVLADPHVSQWHAELDCQLQGSQWVITLKDLGSTNGTKLNDETLLANVVVKVRHKITGTVLDSKIALGPYVLTIGLYKELPQPVSAGDALAPAVVSGLPALNRMAPYPYMRMVPPGLSPYSRRLLAYLPEIYQPTENKPLALEQHNEASQPKSSPTEANQAYQRAIETVDGDPATFLARFLGLFESVLLPLESVIDHFDLYLDPTSAPEEFLPWLERWFHLPYITELTGLEQDEVQRSLSSASRRELLRQAHDLFTRKGTKSGLHKLLTIYCQAHALTGSTIEIEDERIPHHFIVTIKPAPQQPLRAILRTLIEAYKPVHTTYELQP